MVLTLNLGLSSAHPGHFSRDRKKVGPSFGGVFGAVFGVDFRFVFLDSFRMFFALDFLD